MIPILQEVAARSYNYYMDRLSEIQEEDKEEGSDLSPSDRGLVDYMSRWVAGSLYLDMFTEDGLRRLIANTFDNESVQTWVFDLYYHSTVGITAEELGVIRASVARSIAPGFVEPKIDGYGKKSPMGQILDEFQFSDTKWKLTAKEVTEVLEYMPWLVPLFLIRLGGEIVGADTDTDVAG